jgi:Uma2 family endonuclease
MIEATLVVPLQKDFAMTTAMLSATATLHESPDLASDEVVGWTAVDLAERFGPMPLHRICFDPPPGTATEEDVIAWEARSDRLFELIDGVLVEKTMSSYESYLAMAIGTHLNMFVQPRKLGVVMGADGMLKIMPDMIRIPDVCFIAKEKLPGKFSPQIPVSSLIPDLAVEVLSTNNTRQEMEEKLDDYFEVGVREVWYVDPQLKQVRVYEARTSLRELTESDTLDSQVALPGFSLSLKELFADPVSG